MSVDPVSAWMWVEEYRRRWRTTEPEERYWQFTDCQEYGWRVDVMWSHHDGDVSLHGDSAETLPEAILKVVSWMREYEEE